MSLKLFDQTIWKDMEKHSWKDLHKIVVGVVKSDVENCEGDLVVIVYVAGYCCYMV